MERRGGEARPQLLEEGLATQIAELRADLSGKDLQAAARSGSSLGRVKNVEEYRRDRTLCLQALMQVPEAKPLDVQHVVMCEECALCTQPEHTPENLPLLLHQFYCDRVSQLAHLKHMLLIRWARFSMGQPSVTEELQTHFKERMEQLMLEYNDALNRVRCLAVSHDLLLAEKAPPSSLVEEGDVVPYLRWRVYHQHVTKNMAAFLMSIRWIPFFHQDEFTQALDTTDTGTHTTKHAPLTAPQSKWLSATKSLLAPTTKLQSHSYTSQFSQATSHIEGSLGHASLFGGQRGGGVTSDHVTSSVTMASTLRDGGGVARSIATLSDVPQHTTDVRQLQSLLQELMMTYSIGGPATFHNSAEQLQLYYLSSRKFPTIFQQQEDHLFLHTFDRPLDEGEAGGRGRGGKNHRSKLTFRKPANWTTYISTRATPDPVQITAYARIKEATPDVDPLLSLCSHCTHLHNVQRVLYALKQHCVAVRHPSTLTPLSVSSHKTSHDSMLVWKCIYSGLDNRNPLSTSTDVSNLELGLDDVSDEGVMEGGPSNQHIGVPAAMKVINNEEGRKVSSKAESVPKDAYFAFLLLRHLRIRDMRIKCLSILNYFRSVERTLTINSEGLSLEGGQQRSSHGRAVLGRRHLANTPVDHVISEAEFMQCMEVENHDDFYSFSEDGHVRVWDQGGVGVMYDVAMEDLRKLEGELLTMGSYYIMKEGGKRSSSASHNLEIGAYSHQHVDRFAVLLDLWTEEARFLHSKMKVVNSYLEAYHHVYDSREKQKLAEVITTLLACRPRYSPEASYFITTYHKECQCLQAHYQLVQSLIEHQISEERTSHRQTLGGAAFGLPPPLIPKQLVSLSGDKRLLIHTYLLEFCDSLSMVASLPTAIQWALSEVTNSQGVTNPQEVVTLHHKLLELVAIDWQQRTELGAAYTPDVQKHLFTDVCVEDPCLMGEVCVALGNQQSAAGGEEGKNPKEQKQLRLQAWCNVLQLVSLRHHLLLACSESEMLTRLYKQQLASLDLEECHAHLRCVPFDLSTRLPGNKDLDYFMEQAREGRSSDSRLDRYTPVRLHLAVHELDEKHVGRFSFRSDENIRKILTSRNGLEGVRVTLQSQVVHRNTLAVACQQNSLVLKYTAAQQTRSHEGSQFLDSNKSRSSFVSSQAPPTSGPPITITASEVGQNLFLAKELKKAFVSLQQEKAPVRDYMLAQFTVQPSTALRELENTKCALVRQFCTNLTKTTGHYSLRTQTIRQYDSLTRLLQDFPATRDAFFVWGKVTNGRGNTSQGKHFSVGGIQDPRQHRSRPLALLSKDGSKLLNLWYIPHFSEILSWFCDLSVEECVRALSLALHLVSSLHTFLQYLCAHVRLGTSQSSHETTTLGGNWGGTESIGAELQQLQSEIGHLSDPTDPQLVASYISARCRVLFLKYDLTLRHYLRRTLLSTGNTSAIQTLETISIPALCHASQSSTSPHISHPLTSRTPAPLNTITQKAPHLFPWQHFLSSHGAFPSSLDHSWELGAFLYVTLAPFNQTERSLANGELLGMSLLLEDVLQHSELAAAVLAQQNGTPTPTPPPSNLKAPMSARRSTIATEQKPKAPMSARKFSLAIEHQRVPPRHRPSTPSQGSTSSFGVSRAHTPSARPSTTTLHVQVPPLEGAELLEKFLLKMSQLEVLRMEWGLRTLVVPSVSTQQQSALLEEVYADKVLSWARKAVAKQQLRDAARMQLESETLDSVSMATFMTETSTDATITPENLEDLDINEMALREAQVTRLVDLLEIQMIQDTSKHLSKLHHLMLCEGERDDTTLSLDLWRADSMKEITGLPRSHVVEDFTSQLTTKMTEEGDSIKIPKAHLKVCLHQLSSGVLAREKESYLLYASYYESLLRNQYSQLYQKNQDIDHYRTLAEANARQTREEALVFMGEHTQNLILEITALRTKVSELEEELQSQEKEVHQQVQQEYSSLVDSLFSTSAAVKNRFEDYRAQLYTDMTQSLHEVRQLVAENMVKMKEKLRVQGAEEGTPSVAMVTALKGEGTKVIQDENAQLNKMVVKMRALNKWDRHKSRTTHDKELTVLQAKLNALRTKYLELKMSTDEDLLSLQQQVKAMQKNLGRVEQEYEIVKQNLEEERRKKTSSSKSSSKSQETFLVKAGKEQASKIDQLLQELDDKEKQITSLKVDQDQCQRKSAMERSRKVRALQQMKQQMTQERTLKLDAFHQVDELLSQVHNLETQQHTSLRASLHSIHHTPHASSFSHFPTPSTSKPSSTPPLASKLHGVQRPKSQQGRLKTGSEQIDLTQEILALKLI